MDVTERQKLLAELSDWRFQMNRQVGFFRAKEQANLIPDGTCDEIKRRVGQLDRAIEAIRDTTPARKLRGDKVP